MYIHALVSNVVISQKPVAHRFLLLELAQQVTCCRLSPSSQQYMFFLAQNTILREFFISRFPTSVPRICCFLRSTTHLTLSDTPSPTHSPTHSLAPPHTWMSSGCERGPKGCILNGWINHDTSPTTSWCRGRKHACRHSVVRVNHKCWLTWGTLCCNNLITHLSLSLWE